MYKFQNINGKVEIMLYSMIDADGIFGMSARDVIDQIKAAGDNVSIIELRINSDGGDVFEAQAMYNFLKQHKAKVKVYIDGLAASAASIVAMAGEVFMPKNAMIMIHNPIGAVYGEAEEMRDVAAVLDKIRDNIIGIYASKTGMLNEDVKLLMDNETWLTADEAYSLKFADKIIEARNEVKDKPAPEKVIDEDAIKNAVEAERARIKALDELNAPGCESEIRAAKYDTLKDARDVAFELMSTKRFETLAQARHLDALDTANISVKVTENPASDIVDAITKRINAIRGY